MTNVSAHEVIVYDPVVSRKPSCSFAVRLNLLTRTTICIVRPVWVLLIYSIGSKEVHVGSAASVRFILCACHRSHRIIVCASRKLERTFSCLSREIEMLTVIPLPNRLSASFSPTRAVGGQLQSYKLIVQAQGPPYQMG